MSTAHPEGSASEGSPFERIEVSMETEVLSESDIVRSESDIIRTVGSEVTTGVAQTVSEEICGLSHLSRTTTDRGATIQAEVTTGTDSLLSSDPTQTELAQQEAGQDWSATQQHGAGEGAGKGGDTAMETGDLETLPPLSMSPSSTAGPTQEDIVAFAEQYSLNLASKRFSVPVATIKKWMKSSSVALTPKYNSPG
ncbi:hypothetical protein GBAR_LOCUS31847, partial [Geodia barretti]